MIDVDRPVTALDVGQDLQTTAPFWLITRPGRPSMFRLRILLTPRAEMVLENIPLHHQLCVLLFLVETERSSPMWFKHAYQL